jgi:class 3 adenylate cyclase
MHRSEYPFVPLEQAKFLAEHIEGAAFVEIPGSDGPLFWQEADLIVRTIQGFVEGLSDVPVPVERQLATVMFTDIVRSTELASERGDREWRAILDTHDEVVRRRVEAEGGQLVKSTGDGALATFDGPGRAIRCVVLIRRELRNIGLEIRAGIHTGEVEVRGPDVGGVAAHLAARVLSRAQPGEILVSRTVRDLVVGSDFDLQARGEHTLKGFKGSWELFAVTGASA